MKNLNEINKKAIMGTLILITLSILIIFLCFVIKVDDIKKISIYTSKTGEDYFFIEKNDIYSLEKVDYLDLKIKDNYVRLNIKNINFDSVSNKFKVIFENNQYKFIPNSEIIANIIKGSQTIGSFLFN